MTKKRAPGGGRKPLTPTEPTVKVAITLLASQAEAMQQLGNGNLSAGIRKAIENMQSKMYSVKVNGDTLYHNLFKNEAIKTAKNEAAQGHQVFISWFRKSDGQTGYLNSDGNHDITGIAW